MKFSDARNRVPSRCSALVCIALFVVFPATLFGQQVRTTSGDVRVWPSPPDKPKIQYIRAIGGTLDPLKGKGIGGKFSCSGAIDSVQKPYAAAADDNGKLFLTAKERVLVFDLKSGMYGCIGDNAGKGKLSAPVGIAVSRDGRIFVGDVSLHRVLVYAADGRLLASIGKPDEFDSPSGIVADEHNKKLYVVDSRKHRVNVYSLYDYEFIRAIGARGMTDAGKFNYPTNGAVDSKGNLYIVDTGNFRVQKFDRNGKYMKTIGRLGDTPGSLARPKGVAIDSEDHVYVVDAAFQNVQIFNADGQILLSFGTGGWGPGLFTLPAGMLIDNNDAIYVVDQWPGNVQIFQYLGERYNQRQAREPERKKS